MNTHWGSFGAKRPISKSILLLFLSHPYIYPSSAIKSFLCGKNAIDMGLGFSLDLVNKGMKGDGLGNGAVLGN